LLFNVIVYIYYFSYLFFLSIVDRPHNEEALIILLIAQQALLIGLTTRKAL